MANDSDIPQAFTRMHARLLDMEHIISKILSLCELVAQDSESRQPAENVRSLRLIEIMSRELKDRLREAQQDIHDLIPKRGGG